MPLMLIPSIIFWLRWVARIRMDILMIVLNKNRNLFRLLTLGLADHNKFIRDYKGHSEGQAHHDEEVRARNQGAEGEAIGVDEEIVEVVAEESAGHRSTALRRPPDEAEQVIAEQAEEIADLKEYIR